MSPADYAVAMADAAGPLSGEQVETAARILATVELEQVAA